MSKFRPNRINYYVGEKRSQLRDGFGVYYYANKFFHYEGDWVRGKKQGHGKLIMTDGSYYEGEFKEGEMQGHGFRKWGHSGNSYSGEFEMGEMHGYGVLNYADGGQYKGEFVHNSRHGNGVYRDKSGNEYEGSWYNNRQTGHGVLTLWNGDVYEGDFVKGQRQGHGLMHFADTGSYEGQWHADMFSGEGKIVHCSGVVYDGLWLNGQPALPAMALTLADSLKSVECTQGRSFNVRLQLVDNKSNRLPEESGRKFEVTAAFKCAGLTKSHQSLLELIEDIEEKPIGTPFGYNVLPYPLMELDYLTVVDGMSSLNSKPNDDSMQGKAKSNQSEEFDSLTPTESILVKQSSITDSSTSLDDSKAALQASYPPKVTTNGILELNNLFLPFCPQSTRAIDDAKSRRSKGSRTASAVSSSSSEGKTTTMVGQKVPVEKGAKPGEYVLIVKDVTEPPFLNYRLETFFTTVTVLPQKQIKLKKTK